jgi:succinyl-diaminopimelate desuccinylase
MTVEGEGIMSTFEKIAGLVETYRRMMVEMQTELSAIPAIAPQSGGDGEWNKAQALRARLEALGISTIETIEVPDDRVSAKKRPTLVATIPGKRAGKKFWIMTHIDVVPPGEPGLWSSDPYTVIEKDGKLIGRGVEDNQQSLVASVFAARAFIDSGIEPECTVKLLFVSDEETGSDYGIKHITEQYELFGKEDLILVPDSGAPDGSLIEIAEKNLLWLKFRTTGKQCHASLPDLGRNAFVAASDLVLRLNGLNGVFKDEDPIFEPPRSTFTPTKKEANVPNVNTIPGEDVFYIDCRVLPSLGDERVLAEIERHMREVESAHGVSVSYEKVTHNSSPQTPADAQIVGLLKSAILEVYGVRAEVRGIGGGTVAAFLRRKGFDTVVWSRIADTAHMPNEYCIIDNMVGDAKVMAHVMASA